MFYYRLTCLTLYFMSPVAILAKTLSKAGLKSLQSSFMISVYVWRMVCVHSFGACVVFIHLAPDVFQ